MSPTSRMNLNRATSSNSGPYLSPPLTKENPNLLGPNHRGGNPQPKAKPKLIFHDYDNYIPQQIMS